MVVWRQQQENINSCMYCNGNGYILVLLGGSETCYACKGSGKKDKEHKNYSEYSV